MRTVSASAATLIVLAMLLPASSHAAERSVDVNDFHFSPGVLAADPGDQITWTWRGGAPHNVTAYQGATWASPTLSSGTFSAAFGGGVVRYYCSIHGQVSGGICSGMCGVVTDDAEAPPAPLITEPQTGSTHASPVRVSGTASGATHVLVMEGGQKRGEATVTGNVWTLDVSLESGEHALHAVARNALGLLSDPSDAVTVLVDAAAPEIAITAPEDLTVTGSPVTVTGTATDDATVASIAVEIIHPILGSQGAEPAVCSGCGTAAATWEATPDPAVPGLYEIHARAIDAVGNVGHAEPILVLVL